MAFSVHALGGRPRTMLRKAVGITASGVVWGREAAAGKRHRAHADPSLTEIAPVAPRPAPCGTSVQLTSQRARQHLLPHAESLHHDLLPAHATCLILTNAPPNFLTSLFSSSPLPTNHIP